MSDLAKRQLRPPRGKDAQPLAGTELNTLHELLGTEWEIADGQRLNRTYRFKDFQQALAFTNRVGALAESVDHHPEIALTWGRVMVTIWTHSIGGLSEADFVFAARTDALA